jgi:hypothetical protein
MQSISSADGRFQVLFHEPYEPNNGRMLWRVECLFEGGLWHKALGFTSAFLDLNFELDAWTFEDETHQFLYLPTEGSARLIRQADLLVHVLPYQGISTARFRGNFFENGQLIERYGEDLMITNLQHL